MINILKSKLISWLQLIRVPNLFTVPGDILIGYFVILDVSLSYKTFLLIIISLCLYSFGIILNDICDIHIDKIERPNRPLPSEKISLKSAYFATIILAICAISIACVLSKITLFVSVLLLIVIILYNTVLKKYNNLGAFSLAICRILNIILGASAHFAYSDESYLLLFLPILFIGTYILGVAKLAHNETEVLKKRNGIGLIIVSSLLWSYFLILGGFLRSEFHLSLLGLIFGMLVIIYFKKFDIRNPLKTQKLIGKLIGLLIIFQASCLVLFNANICAVLILLLIIPMQTIQKHFYSS